jgi:SdrD B-like domain
VPNFSVLHRLATQLNKPARPDCVVRTSEDQRLRRVASRVSGALIVGCLLVVGLPSLAGKASAVDIPESAIFPGNPSQGGSCGGDNNGQWIRFTAGGSTGTFVRESTAQSPQATLTFEQTAHNPAHFRIISLVVPGSTAQFSSVIVFNGGNSGKQFNFPTPISNTGTDYLAPTSGNRNTTHVMICTYGNTPVAGPTTGTISGIVYRDWNYTGTTTERFGISSTFSTPSSFEENRNYSPAGWNGQASSWTDVAAREAYLRSQEPGEPGITITVTDTAGTQWSGVTGANGTFSVSVGSAATSAVRVEMTIPPSKSYLVVGAKGARSGSNVQFASLGSPTSNKMYFSVANPAEFCKHDSTATLRLVTPCFKFGDQKGSTPTSVLESVPFDSPTSAYVAPPQQISEATANQIGTTFGLAWDPNRQNLFASAFMHRHTGFGPYGTGAIYKIAKPGTGDKNVSVWADLNALFGAGTAGYDPHPSGVAGCSGSQVFNPAVHSGAITECESAWGHDIASYDKVGKMSLGDMDVSENGSELFVVNLNDRQVYKMSSISAPRSSADITRMTIPLAASGTGYKCDAADSRPMAVTIHDGVGYLGVVCSQESGALLSDPRGYVYTFNPNTMVASPTPVLNFLWDYAKTGFSRNKAWSAAWQSASSAGAHEISTQVIVSSITFDDSDMLLGLRNRYRDQVGQWTFSLDASDTTTRTDPAAESGGFVRACRTASGWAAEGDVASGWSEANCTGGYFTGLSTGAATAYGTTSLFDAFSQYATQGSLLLLQGSQSRRSDLYNLNHVDLNGGKLVVTADDPLGGARSGGIGSATPQDGFILGGGATSLTGYEANDASRAEIYAASAYSDSVVPSSSMGNANGLGDLEVLCLYAPIDIGDRVWKDLNSNGIQDPNEPGLDNLTVNLMQGASVVASVSTDVNGGYLFTSRSGINDPIGSTSFNVTNLKPGQSNFWVKVDLTDPDIPAGLHLASNGVGTNARIDSDGQADGGTVPFNIVDASAQNFNLDFGFCTAAACKPGEIYAIGDKVFSDSNENGVLDAGEIGVPGVTVSLLDDVTGAVLRTSLPTTLTGAYVFDVVPVGSYKVKFSGLLPGNVFVTPLTGTDRTIDSDPSAVTGITPTIVIGPSNTNLRATTAGDGTIRATMIDPTIDAGKKLSGAVVGSSVCLAIN